MALASSGAWSYMIDDADAGANDGAEVGMLDTLIAEQAGPFNGGDGNPQGEEDWAESILGVDLTFSGKTETVGIFDTDTADIRAFALASQPGYFIVKNAKYRALFANLEELEWGVINIAALNPKFNLGNATISHVTEFNGEPPCEPFPECDGGGTGVPVPGTLLLLGLGLFGLGVKRRT